MVNALVTGATGFIGAHLCRTLLEKGLSVFAMARKTSDLSLLKTLNPDFDNITMENGDLTDQASLLEHVQDKDIVFNIAGVVKGLRQEDYDRVNVDGTIGLCKALLEKNPGIQRVVLTSSAAAAGPGTGDKPAEEMDPAKPLDGDRYGQSKHRMEVEVQPYIAQLPIVIVRPPSVFGPGDTPSLDLFKAVKGGTKAVVGKTKKFHSIVSVFDLCEGFYQCGTNPAATGELFYFSSGDFVEWGELQDIIGREVFNKQKLRTMSIPPGLAVRLGGMMEAFGRMRKKVPFLTKTKMIEGIQTNWKVSREKAMRLLDWQPKDTVDSTMKAAGEWYLEHGWL
jgi:nucleoside-diphosphate-sugar epimerase